jgi:putative transposase
MSAKICHSHLYTAPTAEAAFDALASFAASPWGGKNPQAAPVWEQVWDDFNPFIAFIPSVAEDALPHHQHRVDELPAAQGHQGPWPLPSDDAVVKFLWLAIINILDKRAASVRPAAANSAS